MPNISRREVIKSGIAGLALSAGIGSSAEERIARKNRVHQSVSRWCYAQFPLEKLCAAGAQIGLQGIDLLYPQEFEVPLRYGLICTMGISGPGGCTIDYGLNRIEHHASILEDYRKNLKLAAKYKVPTLVALSGKRAGLSDRQGADNTVLGLNQIKKAAEDAGVTICLEVLNSKVNHPDYMADHTAWAVDVIKRVDSPNVKILYDIYHMQIMEGNLIDTIQKNSQWFAHYHTGGVPGRHELNNRQEVQWDGVMRSIVETGFQGYVAHEFVPTGDPIASLRQAVDLCDV